MGFKPCPHALALFPLCHSAFVRFLFRGTLNLTPELLYHAELLAEGLARVFVEVVGIAAIGAEYHAGRELGDGLAGQRVERARGDVRQTGQRLFDVLLWGTSPA